MKTHTLTALREGQVQTNRVGSATGSTCKLGDRGHGRARIGVAPSFSGWVTD